MHLGRHLADQYQRYRLISTHIIAVWPGGGGELSKLFSSMRTCAVRCQNDCLKVFLFCGLRVCSRAFVCEGVGTLLPSLLRSKVSHGVVSRQSAVTQSEWVPVLWPRLLYPWICRAVSHKRCNALGMQKKKKQIKNKSNKAFVWLGLLFPALVCTHYKVCECAGWTGCHRQTASLSANTYSNKPAYHLEILLAGLTKVDARCEEMSGYTI